MSNSKFDKKRREGDGRTMKRILALGLLFMTWESSAATGKILQEWIQPTASKEQQTAGGMFIMAVYMTTIHDYKSEKYRDNQRVRSVVRQFLRANPKRLDHRAELLCREAFGDAFGYSDAFYVQLAGVAESLRISHTKRSALRRKYSSPPYDQELQLFHQLNLEYINRGPKKPEEKK